ncbi:Uncharacterised protein [Mycobacteroides abscessus subsp. abscessus]|nr:Uncharacterised protein [Mycobacteroides abscessus subsp. abscessus]
MRLTGIPVSGFLDGRERILLRSSAGATYFSASQSNWRLWPSGDWNRKVLP